MNKNKKITGIASIDKPWLKYYESDAFEKSNDIPKNKTVWDILEKSINENIDIPALEYFKKEISRSDFKDNVYIWARALRGMGISENEVVPIYGTMFPEIAAITLALNMIGATPYFLKLSISKKDFDVETADAKFAIVFDGMWDKVKNVFSDDRFKKVIIATAHDSMSSPKKEIINFLNYIDQVKNKSLVPKKDKYIWIDEAKKIANYYTGDVKVPFVPNRNAFITSSSGTSINGVVKGTIATNESAISQLYQANNAGINYNLGERCLSIYPLTASTSLNCLFFLPLFRGMTLINDPRIGDNFFKKQILNLKPNVVLTTGTTWEIFFRSIECDLSKEKKIDLSYSKMWIIGGDGMNPHYFNLCQETLKKCGSLNPLYSGYGLSEVFSVCSVETKKSSIDAKKVSRPIISVGIPYPGTNVKIVNESGQEVNYNERGELLIQSATVMKGYYNKEDLTNKTLKDNWLHTGDMFSIDENGILYLWGRMKDNIELSNGKIIQLYDIANIIKNDEDVDDAIINVLPLNKEYNALLAFVVFNKNFNGSKKEKYADLDKIIQEKYPEIKIDGYKEKQLTFPCNPITLKKDRHGLMEELDGYNKVLNNKMYIVSFIKEDNNEIHKNYELIKEKILKN